MPRPRSGMLRLWIPSTRMQKRYLQRDHTIKQGGFRHMAMASALVTFEANITHFILSIMARMEWPCQFVPPFSPPCRRVQMHVNSEDEDTGSGFMYSPSLSSLSSANNNSTGSLQGAALGAQRLQSLASASPLPPANNVPYYAEQRPSLARRPCMSPPLY